MILNRRNENDFEIFNQIQHLSAQLMQNLIENGNQQQKKQCRAPPFLPSLVNYNAFIRSFPKLCLKVFPCQIPNQFSTLYCFRSSKDRFQLLQCFATKFPIYFLPVCISFTR